MESGSEGEWREVPSLLSVEVIQTAARSHLEKRGLGARQLEPRTRQHRRQRMAGKKPPLPPQTGLAGENACFGVPLEAPHQQRGFLEPLSGRGQGAWLPRVFVECVRVLRENTGVPGLFRKSGSLARQRVLRSTLECGQGLVSPHIHDVASVLKQYLRELPSPLLPPSLGPTLEWAWSSEEGERVESVMCILVQLPPTHLQMLKELSNLMSLVASQQSVSLMDSNSLAVVMAPNIMPTQHSNPATLETSLNMSTGVVKLMIDHAHLIGMAPSHVINHAHQLSKEGVAAESGSSESLDDAKKKRVSVTDKVLGWGTKLMSTLGGGSRDLVDHTHSPFGNGEDGGGLQLGKFRLFEPSLPPASRATPKTPRSGHKRRSSFLSARRHTDTAGRHGSKTSLFSNPFRGPLLKGGEFSRLGSTRISERKFPWLQGRTPMTPDPDVQLVGFGVRSSLAGEPGDFTDGDFSNNVAVDNRVVMTPVIGNTALLASLSEESVSRAERVKGEERGDEGEVNEQGVGPPKTYFVTRKQSGKRMRCEGGGGGEGGGRGLKRRHTIYTSGSRESLTEVGVARIRTSKSATALGQSNSDLCPGFTFSKPTPQRSAAVHHHTPGSAVIPVETDKQDVTMDAVAPPTSSGVPFTFSNPRRYVAKTRVVSNSNSIDQSDLGVIEGGRVCGASPIPHLPEVTTHKTPHITPAAAMVTTPAPRGGGQLNEGFLQTPFPQPSAGSPNLLQKISSELVERYPQATPLAATPTVGKWAGFGMNDSYRCAVYAKQHVVEPVSLEFNLTPDHGNESCELVQEVSFTFQLNTSPGRHGNTNNTSPPSSTTNLSPGCHSNTSKPTTRLPLSQRPPVNDFRPPAKVPLQRRFALTPLLTPRAPRFTDLSSPFTSAATATGGATVGQRIASKTPRVRRRAQMYVIPSSGSHGDKENVCTDIPTREWIV